jgi:hypothetical protein
MRKWAMTVRLREGPRPACADDYWSPRSQSGNDLGSTRPRSGGELRLTWGTLSHYSPVFIASLAINSLRRAARKKDASPLLQSGGRQSHRGAVQRDRHKHAKADGVADRAQVGGRWRSPRHPLSARGQLLVSPRQRACPASEQHLQRHAIRGRLAGQMTEDGCWRCRKGRALARRTHAVRGCRWARRARVEDASTPERKF